MSPKKEGNDTQEIGSQLPDAIRVCQKLRAEYFNHDNDGVQIVAIRRTQRDLQKRYTEQQRESANIVKELTSSVNTLKNVSERQEPVNSHQIKIEGLNQEEQLIKENIKNMKKERAQLQHEKENIQQGIKQYERELQEAAPAELDVPKVKNELTLFVNISNIKWDFDSQRVRGYITGPKDVKKFDIDPKKCSEFETANLLWDLIGMMSGI
uniref:Kinetochore protein Spc24 n=1 Tax=Paramoeba aestuarina TaxID=180227 RepID=A0A7S4K4J3_9EUKA|mmetsp:Transcript_1522/g.2349  ORF Transcript_1522/g.2349 Transcript_1522/m.2349 type:complete len:210 (+) Transcript_1522:303-932(+)